jgi:hypothetical protein
MRMKLILGTAAALMLSLTTLAFAEDEFDLSVSNGTVQVTTKGSWHVNKDYPWKLVAGDTKLDKTKFEFTEKTAKLSLSSAPKGPAKLKGAVCSGDQCKNFEKDVTVP